MEAEVIPNIQMSCIEYTLLGYQNPALASSFVKIVVPGIGGDKQRKHRERSMSCRITIKTGGEEADLQEKR